LTAARRSRDGEADGIGYVPRGSSAWIELDLALARLIWAR
jgi:hypothetical protein